MNLIILKDFVYNRDQIIAIIACRVLLSCCLWCGMASHQIGQQLFLWPPFQRRHLGCWPGQPSKICYWCTNTYKQNLWVIFCFFLWTSVCISFIHFRNLHCKTICSITFHFLIPVKTENVSYIQTLKFTICTCTFAKPRK